MNNKKAERMLGFSILILTIVFAIWTSVFFSEMTAGQAYNSTSLVNTTVNITNAAPLISRIVLQTPINLLSYNTTIVTCNVSVFDYDNDTLNVNATLYLEGIVGSNATDDGNNHYTNSSCGLLTPQDQYMNYSCVFHVKYYADNSSNWICNATVSDGGTVHTSNLSNYATINPLVAIKMDPLLDYGDLKVAETSNDTIANITNAGNRDVNISVDGYGATDGDGQAFICSFGQIPLNLERYSNTNGTLFPSMTPLTDSSTMISNFYVPQRTNETNDDSITETYWKVQIPIGAAGVCNGKILFTATDRGT